MQHEGVLHRRLSWDVHRGRGANVRLRSEKGWACMCGGGEVVCVCVCGRVDGCWCWLLGVCVRIFVCLRVFLCVLCVLCVLEELPSSRANPAHPRDVGISSRILSSGKEQHNARQMVRIMKSFFSSQILFFSSFQHLQQFENSIIVLTIVHKTE